MMPERLWAEQRPRDSVYKAWSAPGVDGIVASMWLTGDTGLLQVSFGEDAPEMYEIPVGKKFYIAQRSKEAGASPVSRQSSLNHNRQDGTSARGPGLKLTCPVKLPRAAVETQAVQRRDFQACSQQAKEGGDNPGFRTLADTQRIHAINRLLAEFVKFAGAAKDSTDASPMIEFDLLRSEIEDAATPYRGSTAMASRSSDDSSRASSAILVTEMSDVEDVLDGSSFPLEGIPDLELVRASPVPEACCDDWANP
eukprot:g27843.t1